MYIMSDSTGETLNKFFCISISIANFQYTKKEFVFIRTEQQVDEIIKECNEINNSIILYTIVETKLAIFS